MHRIPPTRDRLSVSCVVALLWALAAIWLSLDARGQVPGPEIFGKPVEFAEQLIQATDDLIGLHACRDLSEADDIRKNDGRFFEMIRNIAFSISQARGDIGREYVSQ